MEFVLNNWAALAVAALAFFRVVFSLLPTDNPARPVFGVIDTAISAIVGDQRTGKNKNKKAK